MINSTCKFLSVLRLTSGGVASGFSRFDMEQKNLFNKFALSSSFIRILPDISSLRGGIL